MSKIFIVEDNAESRYLLERLLESRGHYVITAENGEDALRLARQDAPEVIISDIMMPVMNGFRLCREVKKDPDLRNIPFIFYTATFVEEADEKLAMNLGASRFIVKPTEGEQFLQILDEVLDEHRQGILRVPEGPLEEDLLLEMYDNSIARKLAETVEKLQDERKALIKSEQRLKEAQELAHIGHWELDLKTNSLLCSDEIYRILGLKPQEFDASYEAFMAAVHPDDKTYVTRAHEESLAKKTQCDIEYRVLLKDGTIKYVNEKFQTIYDDNGMPTCSIGTVQDITERKRAEEALREKETMHRLYFENVSDVIYLVDLELKLIEISPSVERVLGYKPEELIGRPFRELNVLGPEYLEQAAADTMRVLGGERITSAEYQFIARDGTKKWGEVSGAPLIRDGQVVALISVARDITKRKEAEKELTEANNIINKSSSVVFTWKNQKGWPVEFISENAERIFGYTAEEFITGEVNYAGCIHPKDLEQVAKEVMEATSKAETNEFVHEPYRIIAKDGSEKIINDWTYIVRDNEGGITHYKGIVEDITERKQAEEEREKLQSQLQQAQKMEAIGTLAGGIAHDFNNILGAIIGYTEIANLQIPKDSKAKESLKEVLNAGRRARDLVKQILAFSRKGEQERIPIQIGPVVKEALKLLRSSLPTTIEIRQNIEGDTGIVEADPTQIHQILMNLCTNASHAMREEGGILEVGVRNAEIGSWDLESGYLELTPGLYLLLSVSDTGQGMTPEVLERIFEPYYTTKERGEGTGLGLSVVHGIIKDYGGTIRAYSELGKGSTFNVYLPVIQKKAEEVSEIDEVAHIPTGNENILFIDDEPALVKIGKQMLERLGYRVTTRTSSLEALELFKSKSDQFDLVITDMTMPYMTGERLAGELMNIRSDIPVIICTGFSMRISEEKARERGIKAFIMKPLVTRDLANAIRNVLGTVSPSLSKQMDK